MEYTKNDLSMDLAVLDYEALKLTCRSAFYLCLDRIHEYHEKMRYQNIPETGCNYLEAGYLLREAKRLSSIAETMVTVEGMTTREMLEIVNKEAPNDRT